MFISFIFYISRNPSVLNAIVTKVTDSFYATSCTLQIPFDPLCLYKTIEMTSLEMTKSHSTFDASGSCSHSEVVYISYTTEEFNQCMTLVICAVVLCIYLTGVATHISLSQDE